MSLARSQAAAPFQMHSHDYLLRVSPRELDAIVFAHLCTVQDPSVLQDTAWEHRGPLRAGYTEWHGTMNGTAISLAWDWVELSDGALHPVTAVAPRSNLRLLDGKGYDLAPAAECEALWARIAAIAWRDEAVCGLAHMTDDVAGFGPLPIEH
jgi:hypothetical protein